MFIISVFAVLLQTIYWYRDIYNNHDISNDNYRRLKNFSISPITSKHHIDIYCALKKYNHWITNRYTVVWMQVSDQVSDGYAWLPVYLKY